MEILTAFVSFLNYYIFKKKFLVYLAFFELLHFLLFFFAFALRGEG